MLMNLVMNLDEFENPQNIAGLPLQRFCFLMFLQFPFHIPAIVFPTNVYTFCFSSSPLNFVVGSCRVPDV